MSFRGHHSFNIQKQLDERSAKRYQYCSYNCSSFGSDRGSEQKSKKVLITQSPILGSPKIYIIECPSAKANGFANFLEILQRLF